MISYRIAAVAAATLSIAYAAPPATQLMDRDTTLNWGTIGDSWASGVSYDKSLEYDNNQDNCLRIGEAYTSQMDYWSQNWIDGKGKVAFKACSGARLGDMVKDQNQLAKTGDTTLLFMHAGGNNAGFFDVVTQCIFQQGLPTTSFDCDAALKRASDYINGDINTVGSMRYDVLATYVDIFNSHQANQGGDFYLYHLGYARFFNVDKGSEWCNDISFGVTWFHTPKLTLDVRSKINGLTDDVNQAIKDAVTAFTPKMKSKQHLKWVDVSPSFDGHRFCEGSMAPGLSPESSCVGQDGQYYNSDVWFWNLQWTNSQTWGCSVPPNPDKNIKGAFYKSNDTVELFSGSGGGPQDSSMGWRMRPFHPKVNGHVAIANAAIKAAAQDKVPGVKTDAWVQSMGAVSRDPHPSLATTASPAGITPLAGLTSSRPYSTTSSGSIIGVNQGKRTVAAVAQPTGKK